MYKGVFGYHRAEKARRAEFGLERAVAGEGQCSAPNLSSSLFLFPLGFLCFLGARRWDFMNTRVLMRAYDKKIFFSVYILLLRVFENGLGILSVFSSQLSFKVFYTASAPSLCAYRFTLKTII